MAKRKKSNPQLVKIFIVSSAVLAISTFIAYKQLTKPNNVQAATCTTIVNPGQSINSAISRTVAGGTVCVSPGEYTENVNIPTFKTGLVIFSVKKHQAKIIGTRDTTERVAAIEINANNVTVSGFDVTGPDIKLGIADEGANNTITGNYVHDIAITTPCDDWGGAGIEHGNYRDSNNNGISIGNIVERVSSGPRHLAEPCPYNQGIYHSQPTGQIINNIVKDVDAFCIHLWHDAKSNYKIYNNLVINCGKAARTAGITIGADPSEGVKVTGSTIANNIVINSPRGIEQNNASDNFYRNNIIFGSTSGQEMANSCSNSLCENNRFINPQLDETYHPLANSPVINMGYAIGAPATDHEGKNRGNVVDVGPYEFAASVVTPTNTPSQQPTSTPAVTNTPTPTSTPRPTSTPQPSPTSTPRPTSTPQPTNTPVPPAASLGNTQTANPPRLDDTNSNKIHGIQIRTAQNTTINSGQVYLGNIQSGTSVGVAIYSNTSNNTPGNLIVQSPSKIVNTGWNRLPLLSTTLSANTTYWLVTNNNGSSTTVNNLSFTTLPSATRCAYTTSVYNYTGNFPASMSGLGLTSCPMYFSMYVSSESSPVPTITTTPDNTIRFDGATIGPLRGTSYPLDRSINWIGESWLISPAWGNFTTRNLSFRNSTVFQGNFDFSTPSRLTSLEAYNGGKSASTIRITCGAQTATGNVGIGVRTTITTGFTSTCQNVSLSSTNGWDTNFDNLIIAR